MISTSTTILVIGGEKAVHGITTALESVLNDRIIDSLGVTKLDVETDYVHCVTGIIRALSRGMSSTTTAQLSGAD